MSKYINCIYHFYRLEFEYLKQYLGFNYQKYSNDFDTNIKTYLYFSELIRK